MRVLGIETSCDETAVAIIDHDRHLYANLVFSQLEEHRAFGGVVPEIAARSHLDHLPDLITRALAESKLTFDDLDAIAATAGPGLIGGVFIGATMAKAMAAARGLDFIAVNHLEGHALSARLTQELAFPYLLLLVSGGHCQLLKVEGVGRYQLYGTTKDDAVGEAFDKTAKLLDLSYPGGPAVETAAKTGRPEKFPLPRPMLGRPGCDFSLSGLKTAVRQAAETLTSAQDKSDLAAAFQEAVADVLADRCRHGLQRFHEECSQHGPLVVAGGVAANAYIRTRLEELAAQTATVLVVPPPQFCTDNAAMIAWAGLERLQLGLTDGLDFAARPRWPLEDLRQRS